MSDKYFKTISPIDNSVYCETAYSTDSEVRAALDTKTNWCKSSIQDRIAICKGFLAALESNSDEICTEICWQMGRPKHQAIGEIRGVIERTNYLISIAEETLADDYPIAEQKHFIRKYPVGKVLVIAPWNYPYLTAVNVIIPALLAGNEVILKHSSQTPLCAKQFLKALRKAGLPDRVFQTLYLNHAQSNKVIDSKNINFVSFTGSVKGGYEIQSALSSRFINRTLELGGKDAAYVTKSANISTAVASIVDGAFFNSGQSCCAVERVYVNKDIYSRFVEEFVELTKSYKLGNPLEETINLGPMVNKTAATWVRTQIEQAIKDGAQSLVNPQNFSCNEVNTAYLAPHVLIDVDHSMSLMTDESFGPVVGIMPVDSDQQAIELVNDSPYGLSSSIWSEDTEKAINIATQLEVGTCLVNRCDYLNPALAWTGVKDSGCGVSLSRHGFSSLTRLKSFNVD